MCRNTLIFFPKCSSSTLEWYLEGRGFECFEEEEKRTEVVHTWDMLLGGSHECWCSGPFESPFQRSALPFEAMRIDLPPLQVPGTISGRDLVNLTDQNIIT